jgi:hypothetical protein
MSRIAHIEQSIPSTAVRHRSDTWIDLKCTHIAPNRGGMEAFDFRLTARDHGIFRIEIHWDNGIPEEISGIATKEAAIQIVNGYYSRDCYLAATAQHRARGEQVIARHRDFHDFVQAVCLSFDQSVYSVVELIEFDVLAANLENDVSDNITMSRLECITELKKIRCDMDAAFTKIASGDSTWSKQRFISAHSIDILLSVFEKMCTICDLSERSQGIFFNWTLDELKYRFRLCLQDNYQQRFALFISDPK